MVTPGALRRQWRIRTVRLGWGTDNSTLVAGTAFGRLIAYSPDDLTLHASIHLDPGNSISHIEPVPARNELLVTSESGNIWVVDAVSLQLAGAPFQASGVQLQQTAVDEAGTMVAALDRTGKVRLWRFAGRAPIGPPLSVVPAAEVANADIHLADGGLLVTAPGSDITFIPLATADLATRACALAGRQLTSDEWLKFVGNQPQVNCS